MIMVEWKHTTLRWALYVFPFEISWRSEDQQERKLKQIAEEQRKLDERETNVRRDQEEDKREHRKSVDSDIMKSLDRVRK